MKNVMRANLSKRFGAFLLDLFITILTATLFYSIIGKVFSSSEVISKSNIELNQIKDDSGLFKEYKELYTSETNKQNEILLAYEESLDYYYYIFLKDVYEDESLKNSYKDYEKSLEESGLFKKVNDDYELIAGKENEALSFYEVELGVAKGLLINSAEYKYYADIISNYIFYAIVLSVVLSYSIYIIIIPTIFKKRQTLGQKMLNLGLVNSENGNYASRVQVIFRAFIILIVEIYMSTYIFIPFIISILMIALTKTKSSFHDSLSLTALVDFKYVEREELLK